jgi:hypothetical protein
MLVAGDMYVVTGSSNMASAQDMRSAWLIPTLFIFTTPSR